LSADQSVTMASHARSFGDSAVAVKTSCDITLVCSF
jgi:hypothetical protein